MPTNRLEPKARRRNRWVLGAAIALGAVLANASGVSAFSLMAHDNITKTLEDFRVEIRGQDRAFTKVALKTIMGGNKLVDHIFPAAVFSSKHFTDDSFVTATERIQDLRKQVVAGAKRAASRDVRTRSGDARRAQGLIGAALHTIQDFYSHSTWVESGRSSINGDFGRMTVSDPNETPCPSDSQSVTNFSALSSAYYQGIGGCAPPLDVPIAFLRDPVPVGKCYHGNYNTSSYHSIPVIPCQGMSKDLTMKDTADKKVPASPLHAAPEGQQQIQVEPGTG